MSMIESERLRLRPFVIEDLETAAQFLGDADVMYAWGHGFTKEEVRGWIIKNINRVKNDGCGYLLTEEKESGAPVGAIGLMFSEIDGQKDWEIGYILDKRHWGKGFAQEGARACAKYAFDVMKRDYVLLQMRTDNIASVKVAESIGAKKIGEYNRFFYGQHRQHYIYKLKRECFT